MSPWMADSPCCLASHSVVYTAQIWSLAWPRICFSQAAGNLLALLCMEKKVGELGTDSIVQTGSQETSSLCMLPLASLVTRENGPGKAVWKGRFCVSRSVSGREVAKSVPSICPDPMTYALPKQLNPDLPLGEPTTAEFLCEANHIIPPWKQTMHFKSNICRPWSHSQACH